MRAASIKPEIALLDNEDMQDIEKAVDWQFVPLGEQKNFGIKTAGKILFFKWNIYLQANDILKNNKFYSIIIFL